MRLIVVDDEPLARGVAREYLAAHPDIEIVAECSNGFEAVKAITELAPDLVLLDIQMPKLDGFEVAELVGGKTRFIFATAFDQYAIRAFEIAALDYLLKPLTEERFARAFARASSRIRMQPRDETARQVVAMLDAIANPPRRLTRFAVRSGERTIFVPVEDVDWIEAFQNYVRLHVGAITHVLHVPMTTIESVLDPERFLRIHRSHIVNVQRIAQLWSLAHGQYLIELRSGQRLQSGRTYSDRIRLALSNPF
jgi:two-component system LytT family response regulator